jgi:hypothetical protein
MVQKKILSILVLMLFAIFITGCNTSELDEAGQNNDFLYEDTNTEDTNTEDTNIENINTGETPSNSITGEVVALVNNEEIKKEEVEKVQEIFLMQQQQISEEDALEQVINRKVLEQKVKEEGISVTNQEAEAEIEEQLSMQGATLDDYKNQLESQGLSYSNELENLKQQIATQRYLSSEMEGEDVDIKQEEIQEFYEVYKAQSTEEVPPIEEIQDQISATLEQQKEEELITILIQNLRSSANVEYK